MKLMGFVRLLPLEPSPVLPIFWSGEERACYRQLIDPNGNVSAFIKVPLPPKNRIIVTDDPSYPDVQVGEKAIVALDRGSSDVGIRRIDRYEQMLGSYLSKYGKYLSPFIALEMALLVGDRPLASEKLKECIDKMGGAHDTLALRWLEGASIPEDLRREMSEPKSVDESAFELEDESWVVAIGGPKFLVRGLTQYCGDILNTKRTVFVRDMFASRTEHHMPNETDIEEVLRSIYDRIIAANPVQMFLLSNSKSRARISLGYDSDPTWLNENFAMFHRLYHESQYLRDIIRSGVDISGTRSAVLIYMWAAIQNKYGSAAKYISSIPYDRTHDRFEVSYANTYVSSHEALFNHASKQRREEL